MSCTQRFLPLSRWLCVLVVAALFAFGGSPRARGEAAIAPEAKLKAAYIIKLSQYIRWPSMTGVDGSAPIRIGATEAGGMIDELSAQARTLRGQRPIEVVPIASLQDALSCQVLFLGESEVRAMTEWMPALQNRPILTVSDHPGSLLSGLAIRLVKEARSLKFDVNKAAIDNSRLEVSPEVLRYARVVHGVKEGNR